MATEQERTAEEVVRQMLENLNQQMSVHDLVAKIRETSPIREHFLRMAIWNLVGRGDYEMNNRYEISKINVADDKRVVSKSECLQKS